MRVGRLACITAAILLVIALAAPAAMAATHAAGFSPPFALFGISVKGILKTIAKLLFNVLAGAFLPGWLRHAPKDALQWLIALPDPANGSQWPTMRHLEQDTTAVAIAFLPVTFAIAVLRYTASGVTGGVHHPAESIGRLVGAGAGLLAFRWFFENAVAAVNVTTHGLLSFASIDHGLQRALALMFAGGIAFGVTGPVVALLVIAAILLAVALLIIKVGVLALFALLYVAGPFALALSPVPELHSAWRAWLAMLVALALIPIGWCLIFAVAGAISADITHIGTPAAIGTRLVGFFAGVLTFFLAFRWPFFLIGMVRSRGLLSGELFAGRANTTRSTSVTERFRQSRQALLAGAGAAGSAVSHVGAALGAPSGGLVGASGRAARRTADAVPSTPLLLRGREGLARSWQGVRDNAADSRFAKSRIGRRVAAAGSTAAAAPAAVRAAIAQRGSPRAARAAADEVLERAYAHADGRTAASRGHIGRGSDGGAAIANASAARRAAAGSSGTPITSPAADRIGRAVSHNLSRGSEQVPAPSVPDRPLEAPTPAPPSVRVPRPVTEHPVKRKAHRKRRTPRPLSPEQGSEAS